MLKQQITKSLQPQNKMENGNCNDCTFVVNCFSSYLAQLFTLNMFHWGRHLDSAKALGTKILFTFSCNCWPRPLKEVNNNLSISLTLELFVIISCCCGLKLMKYFFRACFLDLYFQFDGTPKTYQIPIKTGFADLMKNNLN